MKARVADIVAIASDVTGYSPDAITGRLRYRFIMRVRHACYYVARQQGYSYPMIGRRMDRNHVTIMHGCQVIENLLERGDPNITRMVEAISTRAAQLNPFEATARQSSTAILGRLAA